MQFSDGKTKGGHMKTALKDMRGKVEALEAFQGNNVFACWEADGVYAVYSYGKHFPMYANIQGQWYANRDSYSRTTSRHQSACRPVNIMGLLMVELNTADLRRVIRDAVWGDAGIVGAALPSTERINA